MTVLKAKDVQAILGIGKDKAGEIIKALNAELEKKGYYTVRGAVSRKFFFEKMYLEEE